MSLKTREIIDFTRETGTGPINAAWVVPNNSHLVRRIAITFSAAPTTNENLVITLDDNVGPAYDEIWYTVDPAAAADTSYVWYADGFFLDVEAGDQVVVTYNNTDGNTWGVKFVTQRINP